MAMNREQMVATILGGEQVIWKGRVIKKLEGIPTAVELAGDDIVQKQFAIKSLEEVAQAALKDVALNKKMAGMEMTARESELAADAPKPLAANDMGLGPASGITVKPKGREYVAV